MTAWYSLVLLLGISVNLCFSTVYEDYFKNTYEKRIGTTGASLNPDEQCQKAYGNMSYFCRDTYTTGYSYLCASFYCYNPRSHKCEYSIPPQDSTACGNGKWCLSMSCVPNRVATVTSDDCPIGDSVNPDVTLGRSCSELVRFRPSLCYDDRVKVWCCDTCANVTTATSVVTVNFTGPALSAETDCQSSFGADSYFCTGASFYGGSLDDRLCQNLYCYDNGDSTCKPIVANNGVPCGSDKWCVDGKCVASASASSDPYADCLYGNRWQGFCKTNVNYPTVAQYCSQSGYEQGCCSECAKYKNNSAPAGCEYGDLRPDVCKTHVSDRTISGYCATHESDCCYTCANLKDTTNSDCPFGDVDPSKCSKLMEDSLGPGNCYNVIHKQECCETCPNYYNSSRAGCEYGDHWKDWCSMNVKPPKVANMCAQYESQCCGTCKDYQDLGFPGCRYGDHDPDHCLGLMNTTLGTANCYNVVEQSQCCATCHKLKDESTPSCLYGDKKPADCATITSDLKALSTCYNIQTQTDCCRTCVEVRNDTKPGCEYGDHNYDYCSANIKPESRFLCYSYEQSCCQSCEPLKLSDLADCKYGDKNPFQCKFLIPDEPTAAVRCPTKHTDCCETCSRFGHPGPGGGIVLTG